MALPPQVSPCETHDPRAADHFPPHLIPPLLSPHLQVSGVPVSGQPERQLALHCWGQGTFQEASACQLAQGSHRHVSMSGGISSIDELEQLVGEESCPCSCLHHAAVEGGRGGGKEGGREGGRGTERGRMEAKVGIEGV